MSQLVNKCELCGLEVKTRKHHLIPKCKKGKLTIDCCETCENFCHSVWENNELRDTYNNIESILESEPFQRFLKWRRKQSPDTLFKSDRGCARCKRKYS